MDVGVVALVETAQRVDDGARFLARGRVVEIEQRLAVNLLVKNREILAQCFPINCLCRLYLHKFLVTD